MGDQHPELGIGSDHLTQLDLGGVAQVMFPSQRHLGTEQICRILLFYIRSGHVLIGAMGFDCGDMGAVRRSD
jgi:hypothetical protein